MVVGQRLVSPDAAVAGWLEGLAGAGCEAGQRLGWGWVGWGVLSPRLPGMGQDCVD